MESYRLLLDPDDMTPEEQTQRIIELLAAACIRLAIEEKEISKSLVVKNGA